MPILLPSRSPELNPVEKVWQFLREDLLSSRVFVTCDNFIEAACETENRLGAPSKTIRSIRMRDCEHIVQTSLYYIYIIYLDVNCLFKSYLFKILITILKNLIIFKK